MTATAPKVKGALLNAKIRIVKARLGGGGNKANEYDTFRLTGFGLSQYTMYGSVAGTFHDPLSQRDVL